MRQSLLRRVRTAALGASVALALGLASPGVSASASASASAPGYGGFPMVIDIGGPERCLGVSRTPGNGTPITALTCGDNVSRAQWRVSVAYRPTRTDPLSVRLKSVENGRCLDADTGTLYPFMSFDRDSFYAQSWECNDSDQQAWDVATTGSPSRFLVDNLNPAQGTRYWLFSRVTNSVHRGLLSVFSDPTVTSIPNNRDVVGSGYAIQVGDEFAQPVYVDSPGIRCAEAGFSGEAVRVKTDPPTFRCT